MPRKRKEPADGAVLEKLERAVEALEEGYLERLREELAHLEAEGERLLRELERLSPLPVHRKEIRCGKESCRKCPHGPYPYLRVKKEGKWRWVYLGKDWQPPEGFVTPAPFREKLAAYHGLLRRKEEVLGRLERAERALKAVLGTRRP
ncbi:hypothetical protein [Fervidobacterium sp.]